MSVNNLFIHHLCICLNGIVMRNRLTWLHAPENCTLGGVVQRSDSGDPESQCSRFQPIQEDLRTVRHCWADPGTRGQRMWPRFLFLVLRLGLRWSGRGSLTTEKLVYLYQSQCWAPLWCPLPPDTQAVVFNLISGLLVTMTNWTITSNVGLE